MYSDMLSGNVLRYQKAEDPIQFGTTFVLKTVRRTRLSRSSAALYRFSIASLVGEKEASCFCCASTLMLLQMKRREKNNEGIFTLNDFYFLEIGPIVA